MTFFTDVAKAITSEGKRVFIEVSGVAGGQVRAVITPELGAVPEGASPEVMRVYGLMSRPMVITGKPADVEAALATKMAGVRHVLDAGEDALLALAAITQAAEAKGSAKGGAKKPETEAGPESVTPVGETPAPTNIADGF